MQNNNLTENNVSAAIYLESKIDGKSYCKTNGQFTRHLRQHSLTYQEYYEKYVTGVSPKCYCGEPLTLYQKTDTYANSCGNPVCVGKTISVSKSNWSTEERLLDSENKKRSAAKRTVKQKENQVLRTRKTFKEKYGVSWGSNLDEQKQKARQTKLKRHGSERWNNSRQASLTRIAKSPEEKKTTAEARKATNLERYGVENVLLHNASAHKTNKGNASIKDYILPSGKTIGVRGHEPFALDLLFNGLGYKETDVVIHDDYSKYAIEIFEYVNVNKHQLKYYPDIYLPLENKIIEVKSRWWWDGNGHARYNSRLENNLRKRQAVLDNGYNYEVWVFENKYSYRVLKDEKDFQRKFEELQSINT